MNQRFWSKTTASGNGCIEWLGASLKAGYGLFKIAGTRQNILAHRYAYEEKFGPVPYGMYVCHRCDNPRCVNQDHLFLGTPKDNVQDMIQKDRRVIKSLSNESNSSAVLTDKQVLEMRALRGVITQRAMAQKFGIGTSQVSRIMRGQSRSITT
jgi:hypothetical protein